MSLRQESSRNEEVTRTQKPFVATLRVNESRPAELGQQPEGHGATADIHTLRYNKADATADIHTSRCNGTRGNRRHPRCESRRVSRAFAGRCRRSSDSCRGGAAQNAQVTQAE